MHSVRTIHDEATVRLGEVPRPARREKKRLEWAVKCRLRSVCFRVNARWHAPALSYTPIPWAVSGTTASETRAPLRSPPSSRRLRSPTSSEPLPQVFDFVSAPVDTRLLPPIPCNPCSLGCNGIGDQGASALAAILKETQITNLECAAAPECSLSCQRPLTLSSAPPPAPMLAVCESTTSVPKEELLSPRASRATPRCDRSSRPPGARTGSRVFASMSAPLDTTHQ